jgi:hypothetical protein
MHPTFIILLCKIGKKGRVLHIGVSATSSFGASIADLK